MLETCERAGEKGRVEGGLLACRKGSYGRLREGVPVRKMARLERLAADTTASVCCASGSRFPVRSAWLSAAGGRAGSGVTRGGCVHGALGTAWPRYAALRLAG